MPYTVRVEQVASIPTAVVRRRAQSSELSHVVPQACGIVWDVLRARSVQGAQRHVALYLDGEINLEVGVELDDGTSFAGDGEVVRSAMPGGTVATAVHIGPYSGLHKAHAAIRTWCKDHRCALAGPNWEIYGHWLEDETRLRTDVFYLLRNTMHSSVSPVKSVSEIDAVREQGILSSLAGFPILLVFGIAWIAAGSLSFVVPPNLAPWVYVLLGVPAMPVALALERRVGYVEAPDPDPLLPLTLQILFVQVAAFPAILLVWESSPAYVPVAFAAIVGAHFLPFQWVYKTTIYLVLGIVVAVGPFALAVLFGRRSMHYTGFFVGSVLLIGAWLVRAHAQAVWVASRK